MTHEQAIISAQELVDTRNTQAIAALIMDKWNLRQCLEAQNAWVNLQVAARVEADARQAWETQQQVILAILHKIDNPLVTITAGETNG